MKLAAATLILCVTGLLAIGMVMLYSSSMAEQGAHYLSLQAVWAGLGLVGCILLAFFDYRWLKNLALPIFVVTVGMLVGVLLFGETRNGSRRWFDLGFASFQPSEAAKLGLIIVLAWYAEKYQRHSRTFWRGLVIPGLLAAAILAPIFVEPDRGTTILLGAVTVSMLLLAGVRWFYIIPPAVGAAVFVAYSLVNDPVRMRRIVSWLHPEDHKLEGGYQAWQAMLALGAGGTSGLGLGNGRQKLGFVPEHHTDFILSVIGEEMGLVATLAILAGFIAFVICGVYIAWHARDVFGLLLAGGITFLIGLQAFINIGVVTSALPNKGLPLPFISYGGSSLLLMLASVGILINIARQGGSTAPAAFAFGDELRSPQFA